ncbi:MAG: hypothetical protein HFE78_08570 [Clostridiales bacterium]|nr:hypothetical protein [Clostridiales bacterium]
MAAITGWIPLETNFQYIDIPLLTNIKTDMNLLYQKVQQLVAPFPTIDLSGGMAIPIIKILPLLNSMEEALSLIQDNAIMWSKNNGIGWNSWYYSGGNAWKADGSNKLFGMNKGSGIRRIISYLNELYTVYYNRVGPYCGYNLKNRKFSGYGTQIYIKQLSSSRLCVRFVSEQLKKEFAIIEWFFVVNDIGYRIYTNNRNGSTHEYFWYGEVVTNQKLNPGTTDWYFDTENGAVDILLDLNSIVGITAAKGFTISVINYYQGEDWSDKNSVRADITYRLGT